MLIDAFPKQLKDDVEFVIEQISLDSCCKSGKLVTSQNVSWELKNGECICFPYRIYFIDKMADCGEIFTPTQEIIYHCIFSRSCDGYVREKHISALLEAETPDWVIPYILKICEEYVLNILDMVYSKLSETDTSAYKEICRLNLGQFVKGHDRMISYWNEYYRDKCYNFCNYVGKKLYEECFGYVKSDNKFNCIKRKAV